MTAESHPAEPASMLADKPLFRDPVHDGAADPVVIWNRQTQSWYMLYTNRRANLAADAEDNRGVGWVHGTRIGIAESKDGGATWTYVGVADIDVANGRPQTHWAPAVIEGRGEYHMYLTHVPGVFENWAHPREIVHLTSGDLIHWEKQSVLELASPRVIDAAVLRLPDGGWRMFYNEENSRKAVFYADSEDLYTWQDKGRAFEGPPGEGPVAFEWQGSYWMILDEWKGLAVYRSDDAALWERQDGPRLLAEPGTGPDDEVKGSHADVVVNADGRAYLFYFTHPDRKPGMQLDRYPLRRSSLQVTELKLIDGRLTCDRDTPTAIRLMPRR
ncbi:MAG: glycosyl hydrolase [Planctomycetota bacterium]